MSVVVKKSFLVVSFIILIIAYCLFVSLQPEKLSNFESENPLVLKVNTKIREIYSQISWKTVELSDKSKELYNENIDPTINKAKNEINNTVTETKWKIDSVRKTLSWAEQTIDKAWKVIEKWKETVEEATEVFNDVEKMNDTIIGTVNKDVVQ